MFLAALESLSNKNRGEDVYVECAGGGCDVVYPGVRFEFSQEVGMSTV